MIKTPKDWMPDLGKVVTKRKLSKAQVKMLTQELSLTLAIPLAYHKSGNHLYITNFTFTTWDEQFIYVKFDLRYKRTRGLAQFSTSGTAQGRFGLIFTDAPAVCISDLAITALNLRRVPNWADNTWIRDWINSKLPAQLCVG